MNENVSHISKKDQIIKVASLGLLAVASCGSLLKLKLSGSIRVDPKSRVKDPQFVSLSSYCMAIIQIQCELQSGLHITQGR